MPPHSLTMTMIGASLLWVGWFGFNAGSALEANGFAALAFINTFVATAAAVLGWCLGEALLKGKASMLGAASGAVAGLGAITNPRIRSQLFFLALNATVAHLGSAANDATLMRLESDIEKLRRAVATDIALMPTPGAFPTLGMLSTDTGLVIPAEAVRALAAEHGLEARPADLGDAAAIEQHYVLQEAAAAPGLQHVAE